MNLLRNGLLMQKTEPRRRTVLTEKVAFPCGLSAEFITLSSIGTFSDSLKMACGGGRCEIHCG
jgi:hypothetical protein